MSIADRQPRLPGGFAPVRRAVVVGAGTMGAGIAAHLANCGVEVTLLDVTAEAARAGIERQVAAGGFMAPDFAGRVTPGSVDADLTACTDADWVVEAVFEDIDVKRDLYARLEAVRRPGTLVSSNTSTIPQRQLVAGRSDAFARDFTITHFFNPPRTMELLEVVAGGATDAGVRDRVRAVGDRQLGKVVLDCRDTPGFIANRLGSQWMAVGAVEAFRAGLDVETADAVMSRPFGIPRTGVFGLFDLVGINLVPGIWPVLARELPASDACHRYDLTSEPVFTHLLAHGLVGRRGPGGFLRRRGPGGEKVDEVLDLDTLEYRPRRTPTDPAASASDLAGALATDSAGGRYAWTVFAEVLAYACAIAPEVADDVGALDEAMRLGYGWSRGPFELADALGAASLVARFEAEGRPVPALLARAVEVGGFHPPAVERGQTPAEEGGLTLAEEGGTSVSKPADPALRDAPQTLAEERGTSVSKPADPTLRDAPQTALLRDRPAAPHTLAEERGTSVSKPADPALRDAPQTALLRDRPDAPQTALLRDRRDTPLVLATDGTLVARPLPEGVLTVADAERAHGVLLENGSAALVDLGDGVACLALRTKMNTIDAGVIDLAERAVGLGQTGGFKALVIGSDHPRAFSAGANLAGFVHFIDAADPDGLRALVERGQRAFAGLRAAPFPVVAAARGFALGGGCELLMGAHRVVAHAELKAGFPERTVGLVPAWGGVTQSLERAAAAGEADAAAAAFAVTSGAQVSDSAWQAGAWHLLRGSDEVVASARRVLAEAKAVALELLESGAREPRPAWPLPLHDPDAAPLDAGWAEASETDRVIVGRLAAMLTGAAPGDTATEAGLLAAEVDAAVDLLGRPANQARVRHLLETNRPLAN